MIKCIAFDCFGTVFDMSGVSRDEIAAYVRHVRGSFQPYVFPEAWWHLKAHSDAAVGIRMLQEHGYVCAALSNGDAVLIRHISEASGIRWDHVVDLVKHGVYKPNAGAYVTIELDLGIPTSETLMVTANPTFGDVEGAAAVGMPSQVIRNGPPEDIIQLAAMTACTS